MNRFGTAAAAAVGLWIAAALQAAISPRWAIAGAAPDFLIVAMAVGSFSLSRTQAAWLGFFCGFLHGALAGANLTHYIISRTVAAFFVSWTQSSRLQPNVALVFGSAFLLTVGANVLFMFLAAPRDLVAFLGATILSAVYNGVLCLPLYFALRKIFGPLHA